MNEGGEGPRLDNLNQVGPQPNGEIVNDRKKNYLLPEGYRFDIEEVRFDQDTELSTEFQNLIDEEIEGSSDFLPKITKGRPIDRKRFIVGVRDEESEELVAGGILNIVDGESFVGVAGENTAEFSSLAVRKKDRGQGISDSITEQRLDLATKNIDGDFVVYSQVRASGLGRLNEKTKAIAKSMDGIRIVEENHPYLERLLANKAIFASFEDEDGWVYQFQNNTRDENGRVKIEMGTFLTDKGNLSVTDIAAVLKLKEFSHPNGVFMISDNLPFEEIFSLTGVERSEYELEPPEYRFGFVVTQNNN